jgi:kinesin family protein 3/17
MSESKVIVEKINVYCRIRPGTNDATAVVVPNSNDTCTFMGTQEQSNTPKKVTFPIKCLKEISQIDIFNEIAKPIVEGVLLGYNGTICAYGPTNRYRRKMALSLVDI